MRLLALLLALAFLAPVYAQEASGSLHASVLEGDIESVRQLVDAGADLDARDAYGSSPLIIAATFGHPEIARLLIEAGADLAVANDQGSTPLHVAAFFGRTGIVHALVDQGADVYLRNGDGSTAYDIVAAPIEWDLGLYDQMEAALAPLGLVLDLEQIGAARAEIAAILQPEAGALANVSYAPASNADWPVSTPADEGLDPMLVSALYLQAQEMETLDALLLVKNGRLIAERYYREGAADLNARLQSVTKSVTSALVGIALERGCLDSVDQRAWDFFPELGEAPEDPRKAQITIQHLLQMRAGFAWEESSPELFEMLYHGFRPSLFASVPLVRDPDTQFDYSNLSSHLLGIILARACDTDLSSFAKEHLFEPLGLEQGEWTRDWEGYHNGHGDLHLSARELARFGLLYLNGGSYEGSQIVPSRWVQESLQPYSAEINSAGIVNSRAGRYFHDIGYGYQWWSATAGAHPFDLAWGHGGQLVVLLHEHDLVLVALADPMWGQHDAEAWGYERSVLNLVGRFIASLP